MPPPGIDFSRKVNEDFREIWRERDAVRIGDHGKQRDLLRSGHRFAYCLSLIAKAATSLPEHERVFLQELASDALHLVHSLLAGDARAGIFYLRSIIENFWRHLYFKDHLIEYSWLTSRTKYYMSLKDLREYCSWLDEFSGLLKESRKSLENSYAELSKQVHSTSVSTLVLRDSLEQIELSAPQATLLAPKLRDVFRDIIALLVVSARPLFDGLHVNAQSFIFASLDAKRKKRLTNDAPDLILAS